MSDKYDVTIFKLIPKNEDKDQEDTIKEILTEEAYDALEKSTQLKEETLGKFTNGLNIPGL